MTRRLALVLAACAALAGCGGDDPAAPTRSGPDRAAGAPLRYAAIGDSYSSGDGLDPADAWPRKLVTALAAEGPALDLVLNAARSGWTTQQALDGQLPHVAAARPDVVTVMIGTNDAFRGESTDTYRTRLRALLGRALAIVGGDPRRVVVVSIPDYGAAPQVRRAGMAAVAARQVASFNAVLAEEARAAGAPLADVTGVSRAMAGDPSLVNPDGLHPSAKELDVWVGRIVPVVRRAWARLAPAP